MLTNVLNPERAKGCGDVTEKREAWEQDWRRYKEASEGMTDMQKEEEIRIVAFEMLLPVKIQDKVAVSVAVAPHELELKSGNSMD